MFIALPHLPTNRFAFLDVHRRAYDRAELVDTALSVLQEGTGSAVDLKVPFHAGVERFLRFGLLGELWDELGDQFRVRPS